MQSSTNVIVFASQKGGSGKTTLTGHIAIQAELAGAGPVAVIDTDPQRSLSQWRYAREDNKLILKVSDVENISRDIEELKNIGAATIVIDTPPAATSAIGEVVRHADMVCIPTRPSPHDLRAVGATIDIVESHRKPMVFILNSAAQRAKITSEAAMALSQHGTVAPAIIHNRVDFAASMTDGRTVMEVDEASRSAGEIIQLWEYIVQRLSKLSDSPGVGVPEMEPAAAPAVTPVAPFAAADQAVSSDPALADIPPHLMESEPPEPSVDAPTVHANPPKRDIPRPKTPTAEQFFGTRGMVKTPTYFGPDRRDEDKGAPAGMDRRATAFGKRANG